MRFTTLPEVQVVLVVSVGGGMIGDRKLEAENVPSEKLNASTPLSVSIPSMAEVTE
jgi:hypothetical protein